MNAPRIPFLPPTEALVAIVGPYLARRTGLPAPLVEAIAPELIDLIERLARGEPVAELEGAIARAEPVDLAALEAKLLAEIEPPPTLPSGRDP